MLILFFLGKAALSHAQQAPTAEFVADKAEVSLGEYVYLTDISSDSPTFWNWSIMPSNINGKPTYTFVGSSSPNKPVLLFFLPGTYTITLIAGNSAGADTLRKPDYITVLPSVDFCKAGANVADTIREEKGYLFDDGGKTGKYKDQRNCIVVIKPPCADTISLTFHSFDVSVHAHSGTPAGDYLRIYDGKGTSSKSLHGAAGYVHGFQNQFPSDNPIIPPTVKASSGSMYIVWHTDQSTEADGFVARWETSFRTSAPPTAKFTNPDSVYERQPITFTSQSTGPELRYLWDMDLDGTFEFADMATVTWKYESPGWRYIMLIAINCGGTDTFLGKVYIKGPKTAPKADFVSDITCLSEGDVAQFTDLSTEGPWQWQWGIYPNSGYKYVNGTNNKSQNPQVQFLSSGKYTVELVAINSKGASSPKTKTGYISIYTHCLPTVNDHRADIGISRVEIIDNVTGETIVDQESSSGVDSYTHFALLGATRFEVGGKYTIRVSRPSAANKLIGKIWIDMNADGDFTDPGEERYSNSAISTKTWSYSFTLPPTIKECGARLRIGVDYYTMGLDPCGQNPFGEFEDYTINLLQDKVGPVITILGDNPKILEECPNPNCKYIDAGATAFDNVNGDLTDSLIVTNGVSIDKKGTYYVTYQVTDSVGNSSTARRTVTIIGDTTRPYITLVGADTVYHEVNTYYTDYGVYVEDNVTQRSDIKIDTVGFVDTTKLGIYKITYTATDKAKKKSSKTRTVIVEDRMPPAIILLGGDPYKHQVFTPFEDPGVRVEDNYSSDTIYTSSGSVNVNKRGLYYITYTATDEAGNTAVVTRTVKVDDYIPPVVYVPYDTVELEVFKLYTDPPFIRAGDNYFPDTLLKIHRIGMVMDHFTGFYDIGYVASDPPGNRSDTVWMVVHVMDLKPPKMYIIGKVEDTVKRWHPYTDEGYVAYDNYDSAIDVVIGGSFKNSFTPGLFTRTYTAIDKSGNKSLAVTRWITVLESTSGFEEDGVDGGRIQLYPNPANTILTLEIELPEQRQTHIYITNGLGQKVAAVYEGSLRQRVLRIDVSDFTPGMYFIHCQAGADYITRKVVIGK